jgi:hypothetical protein
MIWSGDVTMVAIGVIRNSSSLSPNETIDPSASGDLEEREKFAHSVLKRGRLTQHERFIRLNFSKSLTFTTCHGIGINDGPDARCEMDGLSWDDLDPSEQRVMAMLADGVSTELCCPVALMTLRRMELVRIAA